MLPKGWYPDGKVDGKPVCRFCFEQVTIFAEKRERCSYRAQGQGQSAAQTRLCKWQQNITNGVENRMS